MSRILLTVRTGRTNRMFRTRLMCPQLPASMTNQPGADKDRNAYEVRFPQNLYSPDAIKKAAYRLSDRCAFDFKDSDGEFVALLLPLASLTEAELAALRNDFRNEVLDNDLRESIKAETADVRNVILAYAFSRTGLQDGDSV